MAYTPAPGTNQTDSDTRRFCDGQTNEPSNKCFLHNNLSFIDNNVLVICIKEYVFIADKKEKRKPRIRTGIFDESIALTLS